MLRTGDLGRKMPDGSVAITGRVKELYKMANGKYVMPGEIENKAKISPLITHAMLYGDGREYNILVVVIDTKEAARRLNIVEENNITLASLAKNSQVRDLVQQEVVARTKDEEHKYMIPRGVLLADEDFTVENGLLTPKLSMKRNKIVEKYLSEINHLYVKD